MDASGADKDQAGGRIDRPDAESSNGRADETGEIDTRAELLSIKAKAHAILAARAQRHQRGQVQEHSTNAAADALNPVDWSRRHSWCRIRISAGADEDISRSMDALCGAESVVGYRAALSRLPVDSVPFLQVPVSWLVGVRGRESNHQMQEERSRRSGASRSNGDKTEKQDSKDIGRDRILVNGVMHDGAQESYEAILSSIQEACRRAQAEHHRLPSQDDGNGAGAAGKEDVDGETLRSLLGGSENHRADFGVLARKLIRAVNRTESGGDAWETMSALCASHPLIVPLSKKPLLFLFGRRRVHGTFATGKERNPSESAESAFGSMACALSFLHPHRTRSATVTWSCGAQLSRQETNRARTMDSNAGHHNGHARAHYRSPSCIHGKRLPPPAACGA